MKYSIRSFKSVKLPWQSFPAKWIKGLAPSCNRKYLFPLIWVIPLSVLGGTIAWNLKRSEPSNQWNSAGEVSNLADINLVIDSYIQLSSDLTWDAVAKNLTAVKVGSLTVYKFNLPDTCGFAGCLYVISDGYAKSKALQLWDKPYFEATGASNCTIVKQKGQKYQICL